MTGYQTLIDRYVATWNDVAVLAGDRIESVHGFLDKVPAAA